MMEPPLLSDDGGGIAKEKADCGRLREGRWM
jgi:hypothetical protein